MIDAITTLLSLMISVFMLGFILGTVCANYINDKESE